MNHGHFALWDLVTLFTEVKADYAVLGGLAAKAYGIPRPTYDIDVASSIARDRLPQFYESAAKAGFSSRLDGLETVDLIAGMPIVKLRRFILPGKGIDVDVFLIESLFLKMLLERRQLAEVDGRSIWLVSPEDLILLKLVSFRPRDQGDILDVIFIQGSLDQTYLRHWANKLGVTSRLDDILAQANQ